MGYRIKYGETVTKEILSDCERKPTFITGFIWISIVCCVVSFIISRHKDEVVNFLLPGDKEVTKAAITTFTENLREGEGFADAAIAFCKEIVDNANIPD